MSISASLIFWQDLSKLGMSKRAHRSRLLNDLQKNPPEDRQPEIKPVSTAGCMFHAHGCTLINAPGVSLYLLRTSHLETALVNQTAVPVVW